MHFNITSSNTLKVSIDVASNLSANNMDVIPEISNRDKQQDKLWRTTLLAEMFLKSVFKIIQFIGGSERERKRVPDPWACSSKCCLTKFSICFRNH